MNREVKTAGRSGPLRARRMTWAVGVFALLAIAFSTVASVQPLLRGDSELRQVQVAQTGLRQVEALRTSLSDFQLIVEPVTLNGASASTTTSLARGAQLTLGIGTGADALGKLLPQAGFPTLGRDVQITISAFRSGYAGLAGLATGVPVAKSTAAIAAEQAAYTKLWSLTATIATQLHQSSDPAVQQAVQHFGDSRATILIVGALATLAALSATFVFGQRAHRRQHTERANEQRQSYAASLQEALEMAPTELDVYGVVSKALHQSVPRLQVEMLVADSSRAHLSQALSIGDLTSAQRSGCGVVSPLDCPATIRGHTLLFPTSGALNACPHLQDRPSGACSAACVPISIAGKTVGVTHATGADGVPPTQADVRNLEITSRRASERIAMLRAFEKSETQAHSDPLTGLSNRRSLENRVRDLQREGIPYGLAYGDLDHFKILNDTHGHEAGDQALRLFSRVLRDSIRPNDVAARYGGEEFVIVLPKCDTETATIVLERVRERLALALTTGRVAPFTVSFGLASSDDADTFDEIVAVADRALLAAKAAGRNRVVVGAHPGTVDAAINPA